ncbi:MAG: alpha-L-fucosidase [Bacteroidia bacterium]|nr:alpha-L-fucosidase [Bacteroidia bacterium]
MNNKDSYKNQKSRRHFFKTIGLATLTGIAMPAWTFRPILSNVAGSGSKSGTPTFVDNPETSTPSYLQGYEKLYRKDPLAAAIEWHRNAKWGMFIHYALESLRGLTAQEVFAAKKVSKKDWKDLKQGTEQVDYKSLFMKFTAEKFDADFITDLALEAEMHYVNFTTVHRGGLYMFRTTQSEFTSLNSPAKRDLVEELAVQCQKKKLGLFLYCPPNVAQTEPQETFDRNRAVVRELLTQYGPVAGIWLDGIGSYYDHPEAYSRINELYAFIHSIQPQCLISFKQGTGTEDFVAPEGLMHVKNGPIAEKAWEMNRGKRGDICTNMQTAPPSWLYLDGCQHINADGALALLADAFAQEANLTLNTGPLPDGSIHPDDVAALREAGARIRKDGYPAPALMDRDKRQEMKKMK